MKETSKKTGTSMGRIENTRFVSPIKCNCRDCFHSVRKQGTLYCNQYDIIDPHKRKCKRYSKRNDYAVSTAEYQESIEKKKTAQPTFPWERA